MKFSANTRSLFYPDINFDFSLSHHDQDSYYGSDHYVADQQIAYGNLHWNVTNRKHDITLGATARLNAYDDNTVATEFTNDEGRIENKPDDHFSPALFVQDEYSILPSLTLLGGLRFDYYSRHGFIFAPRFNVKYQPADWTTIRANFGTGFRTVNLFTEDHAFVTGQRTVEIAGSLDPERSFSSAINIRSVYALFGGSGSVELDGHYTHFTNKIIPDYSNTGKIIYDNSAGYARTMGVGFNIEHRFVYPLSINIGSHLLRAQEIEEKENGKQVSDMMFAPKWNGMLVANYQVDKAKLTVAYTAKVTGPMSLPKVYDLDGAGHPLPHPRPTESQIFSLHNLQVIKDFGHGISAYTGIQNLFDFRQEGSPLAGYNDPGMPAGFSDHFDTSYAYAPSHGREYYLGIKWQLK